MPNTSENDREIRRRHTASHVLSAAVKMLWPEAKRGVGPWTDEGFYQDFDFGKQKVSDSDFRGIEKKMRWIVNKNFRVVRYETDYKTAQKMFADDPYKKELIEDLHREKENIYSFYDFVDGSGKVFYRDLCAGPHLDSTGGIGAFELVRIAGSYWRGDEKRPMLTRIYGVAFDTEEALKLFNERREEAARRDHRKLGAELGLFCFSEKVGAGLPLFTPKGTFLRNKIAETVIAIQSKYGYENVWIPHITKKELYETSGHWAKFKDDLFHVRGKGDAEFVMKPMNCPHHTQIYASAMRSYRDLPLRFAEVTTCYRDEQAGELLGLSRVRSLTQDDAHIFCRLDQVKTEFKNIVAIAREFYGKLDMFKKGDFRVSLSVRDPETPEKYLGDPKNWEIAERILQEVSEEEDLDAERMEGEAAFYGPKLDFLFKDSLGREWQLTSPQLDFVMPERFGLEYINEKGEKERPVMIHRVIAGSLERFISVMIEHFGGAFPAWLAPVQCAILPVAAAHEPYARGVLEEIKKNRGRPEFFDASESLGKRIRSAQMQKIPFTLILGEKEAAEKTVTVRKYGEEKDEKMNVHDLLKHLE